MATAVLSEEQEEEKDVLLSIYDSDPCFKQIGSQTFQYRIGEAGDPTSFLIQVQWVESYPDVLPEITMDAFFNSHLSLSTKSNVIKLLKAEAESLIGSPMTYSLFEYAREHKEDMINVIEEEHEEEEHEIEDVKDTIDVKKTKSKPKLSKSAKRRQADRLNSKGELPRGWNWVDIVKLSQTGSSSKSQSTSSAEQIIT